MFFHPLTLSDREAVQTVTLNSGRRNCNYTFANLLGWQFWYKTEICVLQGAIVLRYIYEGERAYSVCTAGNLTYELINALLADSGGQLTIYALEDSQFSILNSPLGPKGRFHKAKRLKEFSTLNSQFSTLNSQLV